MKTILSVCAVILLFSFFVTSQTLTSCTKEKTIHDTVIVNHHDTTIINYHDTMQLTLESCNNVNEGYVNSYVDYANSNHNRVIQFTIGAGTHFGTSETARSFLKFDYKDVPENAILISAKLSLFAIPNPGSGNLTDAHSGSANSFSIKRITSTLNMAQINWNNQPTSTTQNQVIVPQSTSSFQDNTNIDVTNLVKDMLINGNNGFFMQLQSETIYNFRQYCSSYYAADGAKHPKLVLQFKKQ